MIAIRKYCFLLFLPAYLSACVASNQSTEQAQESKENLYYTSAYPTRDISSQLHQIQQSVKRISSTAIYQTYYFDDLYISPKQLKSVDIKKLATRYITHNNSTAGTAFIIARNKNNLILLSCAHVVSFPDTLISYVNDGSVMEESVISAVSIKKSQLNLIYDLPHFTNFQILAQNDLDDLTLLRVDMSAYEDLYAPPLPIQMGNPKDLRLGSYVMVIGYPQGFPMVTRGIISDPNRNNYGGFLTDALFNRGISGGLIMASRDDFASFEWVGMANSAAATKETELVPNPLTVDTYQPFEPYSDTIFVQQKTRISYGITQAIPVTRVAEFLREHEEKLRRFGININRIIASEY